DRRRRFGCTTLTAKSGTHVPSGLDQHLALDVLQRQPAVAHEVPAVGLDHPEPEPVLLVVPAVPRDPALRSARATDLQRGDPGQVRLCHLAEAEPEGRGRKHALTLAPAGATVAARRVA